MRRVPASRIALFFSIATLGCLADLVSKRIVFDWLGMPGEQPVWWLIDGWFGFHTSLNQGALFGLGQGYVSVFALLSVIAAVGVFVWLFVYGAAADRLLTIALACVTAGILGNLYDRLGLHGLTWPAGYVGHAPGTSVYAVRDWILVMIGSWPWPTFNIADSLLVCGAGLLIWHGIWEGKSDSANSTNSANSDGGTRAANDEKA